MKRFLPAWLLLAALAACGDEEPLSIGSELLPPEALRSFEVVLEPGQFLLADTAFALYGGLEEAEYLLLATGFEGVLNARAFARFEIPRAIGVKDTLGVARTDSTPNYYRGEVVLYVDSLAEHDTAGNFRVALHGVPEDWDPAAADWEYRSDGVRWSVPGGTPGVLLDTALVNPDSIVLHVDSATMQQWADTTNARRGALLSMLDAPARLRTGRPVLKVYARTRFDPDTTYVVVAQAPEAKFDYRPRLPTTAGDLRVSGAPTWRSFLHFRPDLRSVTVSCGPGCTVPLAATSITRAELVLQPVPPPAGFSPELPLLPAGYQALVSPEFPLQRSPVGTAIGIIEAALEPERFRGGGAPVYLVVTEFVQAAVSDSTANAAGNTARTDWLTILPVGDLSFGLGAFAPAPRLRLLLTTAREIQLP